MIVEFRRNSIWRLRQAPSIIPGGVVRHRVLLSQSQERWRKARSRLGHRLQRWPSLEPALRQRLLLGGNSRIERRPKQEIQALAWSLAKDKRTRRRCFTMLHAGHFAMLSAQMVYQYKDSCVSCHSRKRRRLEINRNLPLAW